MCKFAHKKSGFTLIELLVVIAIISILAAILFPVFAQAREKARQITCTSNLKQLGIGFLEYSQDFDEYMPSGYVMTKYTYSAPTGQNSVASFVLDAYIKGTSSTQSGFASVWTCPDQQVFNPPYTSKAGVTTIYPQRSFVMNTYLVGPVTGKYPVVDPDSLYSRPADDYKKCFEYGSACTVQNDYEDDVPISANHIANPSMTDLLFEGVYEDVSAGASFEGIPPRQADWTLAQGHYTATGITGEKQHWYSANTAPGPGVARHTGLNNYLFCDGHVKAMHPEPEGYDISQHWQDNIWLAFDGRDGNPPPPTTPQ